MKLIFAVILQLLCSSFQFAAAGKQECQEDTFPRRDCGYYGINAEECIVVRGCCWHPKDGEPWCFMKTDLGESDEQCFPDNHPRVDCGFSGIDETHCKERGCCWSAATDQPWCFKKSAPATEAPATEAPATEAPATEAPATEAPAAEAPAHRMNHDEAETPASEGETVSEATLAPAVQLGVCLPDIPREDCGYYGITQQECEGKGCCWHPAQYVPWCFRTTAPLTDEQCISAADNRVDCGYFGIDQQECEENGCCWSPEYDQPWCFKKAAPVTEAPATDHEAPATEAPATEAPATDAPAAHRMEETLDLSPATKAEAPATEGATLPPVNEKTLAPAVEAQCLPNKPRDDCGHYGITQEQCEEKGCCWSPEHVFNLPWCFRKTAPLTDEQCISAEPRVDCGYFGIDQEECEGRGCCWSPEYNQPWCFEKRAPLVETLARILQSELNKGEAAIISAPVSEDQCVPENPGRQECGSYGITSKQCETTGCCWSPDYEHGEPSCFKRTPPLSELCLSALDSRVECGYYVSSLDECASQGCCWSPTYDYGEPWCFEESAPSRWG